MVFALGSSDDDKTVDYKKMEDFVAGVLRVAPEDFGYDRASSGRRTSVASPKRIRAIDCAPQQTPRVYARKDPVAVSRRVYKCSLVLPLVPSS